jgi:hypothetical protein
MKVDRLMAGVVAVVVVAIVVIGVNLAGDITVAVKNALA